MPTSRPRHLITESDAVATALEEAARRWPEDRGSRARLLVRLIEEGRRSITSEEAIRRAERAAAVHRTSGALSGSYGPGYLDRLREDWAD